MLCIIMEAIIIIMELDMYTYNTTTPPLASSELTRLFLVNVDGGG